MNEEVRKAVALAKSVLIQTGDSGRYPNGEGWGHVSSSYVMQIPTEAWNTIRAELTRLTEIADSVDLLVVRLGEVTTRLEAAEKVIEVARRVPKWTGHAVPEGCCSDVELNDAIERYDAHLSEPHT